MTDPFQRTPNGLWQRVLQRLDAVEARLLRIFPDRLAPNGAIVTDWNDATASGFYWADAAINGPAEAGTLVTGVVTATATRIVQEVWPATITEAVRVNTWRRTQASGTWTAWAPVGAGYNMGTIEASLPPSAFPSGLSYGQSGSGFPTSLSTIEVVRYADTRAVQRCYEKGDGALKRAWHRNGLDSSTWGPWALDSADSGDVSITPALGSGTITLRQSGSYVQVWGSLTGLSLADGTNHTLGNVPNPYRPASGARRNGGGDLGSAANFVVPMWVDPSGNIRVRNPTGAVQTACNFTCGWFV